MTIPGEAPEQVTDAVVRYQPIAMTGAILHIIMGVRRSNQL
jgi:hypothetical protein